MNLSEGNRNRALRLRGRRCVRCGKKLEGYRRIFCGAECRREDRAEKMRLKRAKGLSAGKCPTCGRRAPSGKAGVNVHTGPSSHDRRGSGGRVRGERKDAAERQGGKEARRQGSKEAGNGFTAEARPSRASAEGAENERDFVQTQKNRPRSNAETGPVGLPRSFGGDRVRENQCRSNPNPHRAGIAKSSCSLSRPPARLQRDGAGGNGTSGRAAAPPLPLSRRCGGIQGRGLPRRKAGRRLPLRARAFRCRW